MATVINPESKGGLLRYGAARMDRCFSCGNCTAVCPLSQEGTAFPRKFVRYAQLGLEDRLATAPEPWLCYYCGECSATCPKEATPGETMAAARRFAIAKYDPSGLAGLMFRSPAFAVFFTLLLSGILAILHLSIRLGQRAAGGETRFPAHWAVFSWIPYETIHILGVAVGALMGIVVLAGLLNAARLMLKSQGGFAALRKRPFADFSRAFGKLAREVVTMKRHGECDTDTQPGEPWCLRPRFAHGTILAGFVLLAAATGLDFFFVFVLKTEFYAFARVAGIIGGLLMLYGVSVYTWKRMRHATPNTQTTTLPDAWLLFFLSVLGLTGFALLAVTGLGLKGLASDVVVLVHSVMAMEIVLLFTLTKLAHALYRPMALFFHFLNEPPTEAAA